MDTLNKVIGCVEIAKGTIDKAPIYPRLVVEKALQYNAASVILTHNHPGGNLQPSQSDMKVTKFLMDVLEKVEVIVTDHIIACGDKTVSFAEKKLLGL